MQRMQRVGMGWVVWALTFAAAAQQPIIYPAKGQSAQKQNTDTAECQLWAKQTTGVDPVAIAQQSGQPGAPQQQGGAIKGAAGGQPWAQRSVRSQATPGKARRLARSQGRRLAACGSTA